MTDILVPSNPSEELNEQLEYNYLAAAEGDDAFLKWLKKEDDPDRDPEADPEQEALEFLNSTEAQSLHGSELADCAAELRSYLAVYQSFMENLKRQDPESREQARRQGNRLMGNKMKNSGIDYALTKFTQAWTSAHPGELPPEAKMLAAMTDRALKGVAKTEEYTVRAAAQQLEKFNKAGEPEALQEKITNYNNEAREFVGKWSDRFKKNASDGSFVEETKRTIENIILQYSRDSEAEQGKLKALQEDQKKAEETLEKANRSEQKAQENYQNAARDYRLRVADIQERLHKAEGDHGAYQTKLQDAQDSIRRAEEIRLLQQGDLDDLDTRIAALAEDRKKLDLQRATAVAFFEKAMADRVFKDENLRAAYEEKPEFWYTASLFQNMHGLQSEVASLRQPSFADIAQRDPNRPPIPSDEDVNELIKARGFFRSSRKYYAYTAEDFQPEWFQTKDMDKWFRQFDRFREVYCQFDTESGNLDRANDELYQVLNSYYEKEKAYKKDPSAAPNAAKPHLRDMMADKFEDLMKRIEDAFYKQDKTMRSLFGSRETMSSDLAQKQKAAEDLNKKLAELDAKIADLQEEKNEVRASLDETEAGIEKNRQLIEDLNKQIEACRRNIEQINTEESPLKAKLDEIREAWDQALKARDDKDKEHGEILESISEIETKIKRLDGTADELKGVQKEFTEESDHLLRTRKEISDRLKDAKGCEQTAESIKAKLAARNQQMKQNIRPQVDPFIHRLAGHGPALAMIQTDPAAAPKPANPAFHKMAEQLMAVKESLILDSLQPDPNALNEDPNAGHDTVEQALRKLSAAANKYLKEQEAVIVADQRKAAEKEVRFAEELRDWADGFFLSLDAELNEATRKLADLDEDLVIPEPSAKALAAAAEKIRGGKQAPEQAPVNEEAKGLNAEKTPAAGEAEKKKPETPVLGNGSAGGPAVHNQP